MSVIKYVETKEYIVTLKNFEDLDQFYQDMETPGGTLYIPNRSIPCTDRRPTSRNTFYMLTEWEAAELRGDERVAVVELHPRYLGIKAGTFATTTQTSTNWNKSGTTNNAMLNWALLRCTEGIGRAGWGSNGAVDATGTVKLTSTGKNVDVVVVDAGNPNVAHPEYAVNADGTGGSRMVSYNWYQHNPAVTGGSAGNYALGTHSHSVHVAGTVAGNTQGWARDANIYNIYYDAGDSGNFSYVFDYVREFHKTKSVNTETGIKNPTITNNSWGQSIFPGDWTFADITAVTYQGTRYTPGGATTYNGFSGVCAAGERLATLAGFENFGNRITTTGAVPVGTGSIASKPASWLQDGDQAYLTIVTAPDATYTVTVQGPANISIINNVALEPFSGSATLTSGVTITEGVTPVANYTDGPVTGTEGVAIETDIRETLALPNNAVYTLEFTTTYETTDPDTTTFVAALSVTVNNAASPASATVSSVTPSILGAASLASSTTPTVGLQDDGYWDITLPWNITYLGVNYNHVFVGTNFYLTFGAGSAVYTDLSATTPNIPKIMMCAADRSAQRIYYGIEGADVGTLTVTNSGASAYTINSSSNPTLTLQRGGTYTFDVSASGHPFWIQTVSGAYSSGNVYNTGVTNNGTDAGTITFTVPTDAPSTLYYVCQLHSSMRGTINIIAGTRTYRVRLEGHTAYSGGVLGSPTMVCEYVFYENNPTQIDLQIGTNNAKTSGSGFTTEQLNAWGFIADQRIPTRVAACDADIETAINEGIIFVGAAGNGRWKHDIPGGVDWDNTFEMGIRYPESVTSPYYYMKGSSPTANDTAIPNICVGSIDVTVSDYKASYSDCGPGVDIWAPGTNIISSYLSGVGDSRNGTHLLGKISGTSMASPNVCGVLACALEQNPHWNQTQAKAYIVNTATQGQITNTTEGPADSRDLQGAPNKYLYYKKERPETGTMVPRVAQGARPSTGMVFPRPRIHRFGK
jgi:hypothetical protein